MSVRRFELDTAKGLGMIFVIAGHASPPGFVQVLVYGFHMPLFFMISGILWRGSVDVLKSARSLLVPFYLASLLSWLIWVAKQYFIKSDGVALVAPLLATVYGGNLDGSLLHNAPLWYLPALLTIYLVLAASLRVVREWGALCLLTVLGLWVLSIASIVEPDALPMSALQGAVGGMFFAFGVWGRALIVRSTTMDPLVFAGLLLLYLAASWSNGRVDLATLIFGSPWLYMVAGLVGSIACLRFAQFVPVQRWWLMLLGRQSLLILVSHLPLMWIERFLLRAAGIPDSWWLLTVSTSGLYVLIFRWADGRVFLSAPFQRSDR